MTITYIDYNDEHIPSWKKDVWQRVERGSDWLDNNFPDWYTHVDPILLDMSDGAACICGQVFARISNAQQGFNYFVHHYGGDQDNVAVAYGFLAGGYEYEDDKGIERYISSEEEYSALAEEWLHVISKRMANDGLNVLGDPIR